MTLTDRHQRIERIDQLIRQRRTGSARALARLLGIHERTVFEELDNMRAMGADIQWCAQRRSYHYANSGYFKFGWVPEQKRQG